MNTKSLSAIPGAETFAMEAEGLDVELRISIARSAGMQGREATASNIIYVTDADFCFGTVVEAVRMGCYGGEVAPATVVGIGYTQETGDYAFAQVRRGLDFYRGPIRTMEMPGAGTLQLGGADAFLAALLNTILPEIERRVVGAAEARRILFGISAGGHFAAHVLTQRPDLFAGYAMLSPALFDFPPHAGAEELVNAVKAMPAGSIPAGVSVFLSAGAREENPNEPLAVAAIISNVYRMRSALATHGISTELAVFADETHTSVLGVASARALRFLAPPRPQF